MRLVLAGVVAVLGLFTRPAFAAACDGFTDVDSSNSFCSAVTYLKDHGITLGCTGTTYCPNAYVTRLQMAAFLQRAGQGDPTNTLGDSTTAIGGGTLNTATGPNSVVGGGLGNVASAMGSAIGGGQNNTASGVGSSVPGGQSNQATGGVSFAAGFNAIANRDGCFVWGDSSTENNVRCQQPNRFVARSLGGFFLITGGGDQDSYTGAELQAGAGAWTTVSDRASKDNLQAVDPSIVLRSVVAMPIATWNWKSQDTAIRHMGPMAQDFAAAFGLGETTRGINTVDADGVALAAIQGLNAKVEEKDARIAALERAMAQMQAERMR